MTGEKKLIITLCVTVFLFLGQQVGCSRKYQRKVIIFTLDLPLLFKPFHEKQKETEISRSISSRANLALLEG
jgi:hypothetical protein